MFSWEQNTFSVFVWSSGHTQCVWVLNVEYKYVCAQNENSTDSGKSGKTTDHYI